MRHHVQVLMVWILCFAGFGAAGSPGLATPVVAGEPVREAVEVLGRPGFLLAPVPEQAEPRPWVWYAPTLGDRLPGKEETWMFERLLGQGIAITGVDVGESYGSPQGCAVFQAFYEELTQQQGYSPQPVLLARSRGGLMLYNWAADHPDCVAGIAGIYPVSNIASYPGVARAAPAYGLTADRLQQQLDTFNPIARIARLAAAGVPVFHLHGDADKVVPLEDNSELLATRYRAAGGTFDLETVAGGGHTMARRWFESTRLTDFMIQRALAAVGQPSTTVASAAETVTVRGTFRGGIVAVGGETTGWSLECAGESEPRRLEVDVQAIADPERFSNAVVTITGTLVKKDYLERGTVTILRASHIAD